MLVQCPENSAEYLTPGKIYHVYQKGEWGIDTIVDDEGVECPIFLERCSHLNNQPWIIVEESNV